MILFIAGALWMSQPAPLPDPTSSAPIAASSSPATDIPPSDTHSTLEAGGIRIETYENPLLGYRISYPDIYGVSEEVSDGYGTVPADIAIFSPDEERNNTNLIESLVIVGRSSEARAIATCAEEQEGESTLGSITLAGTLFMIFTHDGAAAGNRYQAIRYRTVHLSHCYEITLLMHSGTIENYPPGTVREFDRVMTLERLKAILYSFSFTQ